MQQKSILLKHHPYLIAVIYVKSVNKNKGIGGALGGSTLPIFSSTQVTELHLGCNCEVTIKKSLFYIARAISACFLQYLLTKNATQMPPEENRQLQKIL